jgi:hypothetical protein
VEEKEAKRDKITSDSIFVLFVKPEANIRLVIDHNAYPRGSIPPQILPRACF